MEDQFDDDDAIEVGAWGSQEASSEESEAPLTDSDADTDEITAPPKLVRDKVIEAPLWPASRLRERGLSVPSGDTPSDLIPSDPDDGGYGESSEDLQNDGDEDEGEEEEAQGDDDQGEEWEEEGGQEEESSEG